MLLLGISQDLYDSGVALSDGQRVLYAANEERFTRVKNQGGFPWQSLQGLLDYTGVDPADIGGIHVAGEMTPPLPLRMFPSLHRRLVRHGTGGRKSWKAVLADFVAYRTPLLHTTERSFLRRLALPLLAPSFRRTLPRELKRARLSFVEHHRAHAASAFVLSGYDEALVLTGDGMGDGLSLTVGRFSASGSERLQAVGSRTSLGLFFESLTEALGFTPCRDEGKLTGLAAAGEARRVTVPSPFCIDNGRLKYSGPLGLRAVSWAREKLISQFSREDISAWAQEILEENVIQIARRWLNETGLSKLCVAGGIFANVKLNQKLHELPEVESLFVCPNMGDGGLSIGALCVEGGIAPAALDNVFWGDSFSDQQIEQEIKEAGFPYEQPESMDETIADLLVEGKLVARFCGRMEWGPRALGNRSVLARASVRETVDRLNSLLKRSDFMPFAPAIIEEDVPQYVVDFSSAVQTAEFMTVCFRCTDRMIDENPAVVHVDRTARMQIVRERTNPTFHRLMKAYQRRTGSGVILNTSFNIHEEPIVRTPREALTAFASAGLDHLAIGSFLVGAKR